MNETVASFLTILLIGCLMILVGTVVIPAVSDMIFYRQNGIEGNIAP